MKNLSLELYKKMYLIRMVEEKIREIYPKDEIKTPTHLAIGEEAIAVGVCQALRPDDQVFGTYRNHGIYLAKTGDVYRFFAELLGKKTGLSKGKAGSMHIMKPEKGLMVTSAIVGSTIPVAVGAAFANWYQNNKKMVASFFGDGAVDEGVFWESVNFACLKKLPILFIYEDNGFAIHSPTFQRHGYQSIGKIVAQFNCYVFESETTDVEKIYQITKKAIDQSLSTHKPSFLHFKYYRYLQHVGMNYDFHFDYRSEEEYKRWLKVDPIELQKKRLFKKGWREKKLVQIEKNVIKKINQSVSLARKDEFPQPDELYKDVYYE